MKNIIIYKVKLFEWDIDIFYNPILLALRQRHSSSPTMQFSTDVKHMNTVNLHELLERMPNCINRELIDATAVDFLKHYARNKAHRKRLIQHLLQVHFILLLIIFIFYSI